MYRTVTIVGPPTHFPLGLGDFLRSFPKVEIALCHPDYNHLSKYFFGEMVEDIILDTPNLKTLIRGEPPSADLTIIVTDENKTSYDDKVIYWPKEKGSVDLREFIKKKSVSSSSSSDSALKSVSSSYSSDVPKESLSSSNREEKTPPLSEENKNVYYNLFSPGSLKLPSPLTKEQETLVLHIVKDVTGVLLANRPCLSNTTYSYVVSDDVCDILDWFNQFCEENGLQQDAISIHYMIEMGLSWSDVMMKKKLK